MRLFGDTKISPTLLIGLGGSGQLTLKWILELAALAGIPINIEGSNVVAVGIDAAPWDVDCPHEETGEATVGELFYKVTRDGQRRTVQNYAPYRPWVAGRGYQTAMSFKPAQGSGQDQWVGRLSLLLKSQQVATRLDQAVKQIMQREEVKTLGVNVFIICSSCGGTGGAMFFDVAQFVRTMLERQSTTILDRSRLYGVVYGPRAFDNVGGRYKYSNTGLFANACDFLLHTLPPSEVRPHYLLPSHLVDLDVVAGFGVDQMLFFDTTTDGGSILRDNQVVARMAGTSILFLIQRDVSQQMKEWMANVDKRQDAEPLDGAPPPDKFGRLGLRGKVFGLTAIQDMLAALLARQLLGEDGEAEMSAETWFDKNAGGVPNIAAMVPAVFYEQDKITEASMQANERKAVRDWLVQALHGNGRGFKGLLKPWKDQWQPEMRMVVNQLAGADVVLRQQVQTSSGSPQILRGNKKFLEGLVAFMAGHSIYKGSPEKSDHAELQQLTIAAADSGLPLIGWGAPELYPLVCEYLAVMPGAKKYEAECQIHRAWVAAMEPLQAAAKALLADVKQALRVLDGAAVGTTFQELYDEASERIGAVTFAEGTVQIMGQPEEVEAWFQKYRDDLLAAAMRHLQGTSEQEALQAAYAALQEVNPDLHHGFEVTMPEPMVAMDGSAGAMLAEKQMFVLTDRKLDNVPAGVQPVQGDMALQGCCVVDTGYGLRNFAGMANVMWKMEDGQWPHPYIAEILARFAEQEERQDVGMQTPLQAAISATQDRSLVIGTPAGNRAVLQQLAISDNGHGG